MATLGSPMAHAFLDHSDTKRQKQRRAAYLAANPPRRPIDVTTFSTKTGDGTTSIDAATRILSIAYGTTTTSLRGSHTVVVGQRYRVRWTLAGTSGGQAGFGTAIGGTQYRPTLGGSAGVNSFDFTAATTTFYPTFQRASAGTTTFSAITIQTIPEVVWQNISPTAITPAFWTTLSAGVTVNGTTGAITIAATGSNIFAQGSLATTVGKAYRLNFTVANAAVFALIGTTAAGTQNKSSSVSHSPGAVSYEFLATGTTTYFQFQRSVTGTTVVSGIVLQELA